MQDKIIIKGAREHNLKNISLELPRNKMIVFTGLSGSGKSSLAFDTIFAEGQRRYVESLSAYARQFLGQMDKPDVDEIEGLSPAISIDQKAHSANPRSTVATITEIYDYLRVLYARIGKPVCPICGATIKKMTPEEIVDAILRKIEEAHQNNVSPPYEGGARGGKSSGYLPAPLLSKEGIIGILAPAVRGRKGEYYQMLYDFLGDGFGEVRVDGKMKSLRSRIILSRYKQHTIELVVDKIQIAWPLRGNTGLRARLAEAVESALKYGHGVLSVILDNGEELTMSAKFACPNDNFSFPEIEPRLFSFNSPYGACEGCHGLGTEFIFSEKVCPVCEGKRLKKEALHVFVGGKNIYEVGNLSIGEANKFFVQLVGSEAPYGLSAREIEISSGILKEVQSRLGFMLDVGLDYLSLARQAGTLSGGEAQRIRLASQTGSRLVGALYVLDEPTIGLHQRDNRKLVKTLCDLRDAGNTIIVVEHDEDTILSSDYLVDLGPGAGEHGGKVVVAGPTEELLLGKNKSLTLQYIRGEKKIPVPKTRRVNSREKLKIIGAKANNLKNINVELPLRRMIAVTGVSGSGKSTLVNEILYKSLANKFYHTHYAVGEHKTILGLEYLDKVIVMDQSAIGRTPRSNPATYTGAFTYIRELFSATPEARMRGWKPGRFSFNRPGGRCENCEGNGVIAIEMHFLPTVYVPCEVCNGKRFDRETLEVRFKEKNIDDVLGMTIEEADNFFRDIPWIHDRLKILNEVGLGYLRLGQPATTLSGGEAQRIKLGSELARRGTGRTLYILDEPTVGLHYADVEKLLLVLNRLVERGNTVVVIEHNLDVIKTADYIVDLGPEGGDRGGEVVAAGTPEEIADNKKSFTGEYLKKVLT